MWVNPMVGILSPDEIASLLMTARFARLGCHADGKTYVVPISFAYDGSRLIGETTLGMKIRMMRKSPEVCVEVDDVEDLANWRSVILWGRFQELTGIEAANAVGLLIDKYGPVFQSMTSTERLGRDLTPPRLDAKPATRIVYCVNLTERSGRFEKP
jgi:nitroimidazol reductase NimA-like FMN-containing flavoprotein (pyridoxamine 5'-phosphate oxidase superfamily)